METFQSSGNVVSTKIDVVDAFFTEIWPGFLVEKYQGLPNSQLRT